MQKLIKYTHRIQLICSMLFSCEDYTAGDNSETYKVHEAIMFERVCLWLPEWTAYKSISEQAEIHFGLRIKRAESP